MEGSGSGASVLTVENTAVSRPTPVEILAEVEPSALYAMAHNRISPIRRLTLRPTGGVTVHDVRLDLAVVTGRQVLSKPWQRHVTELRPEGLTFSDSAVDLDAGAMAGIDEQHPGSVVMQVTAAGHEPVRQEFELQVLAHNQWSANRKRWPLSAEVLCAFVMPNHPGVTALTSEAADRLHRSSGSPSLEGYQSEDPARVHEIAGAAWEALQARHIRYSNPPASWDTAEAEGEMSGQKVRTPGQVLDDRFGTCLDLAVLYAAVLEQAGLHPLLWVTRGHAFVGYWAGERRRLLGSTFTDDPMAVANTVDVGDMVLVETTMVCEGERPATFADATQHLKRAYLGDRLDEVRAVVDIREARRVGITPLPARTVDPDGTVVVHQYQAAARAEPAPVTGPSVSRRPTAAGQGAEPSRVRLWKSRLLDLSRTNKLVNFTTTRAGVDLHVPPRVLPTFEDAIHAGREFTLYGGDEIPATFQGQGLRSVLDLPDDLVAGDLLTRNRLHTGQNAADAERRLRTLANKARILQQETGANALYVTVGLLRWRCADGKELRSPLMLVPVRLKAGTRGRRTTLVLDDTEQTTTNYCLVERLRQDFGLDIPGLAEPAEDGLGLDVEACFRAVREALAAAQISGHVEEKAALAVLDYLRFPLWRDLDENWARFAGNRLVKHLIDAPNVGPFEQSKPPAEIGVDSLDALAARCPVPADSAQLEAVDAAVRGETFVLEGPPGTGKSQTITNLLARAMAEGRTVLFVAEKAAALDVVKRRVDDAGLGSFTLDLHNRETRPARIRKQLLAALELQVDHDAPGYRVAASELAQRVKTLAGYAHRLHEPGPVGPSAYGAREEFLAQADGPRIDVPQRLVLPRGVATLTTLREAAAMLPEHAHRSSPRADHPWGFVNEAPPGRTFEHLTDESVTAAVAAVDRALAALDAIVHDHAVAAALHEARDVDDLWTLATALAEGTPGAAVLDEIVLDRWRAATAAVQRDLRAAVGPGGPADGFTLAAWTLPVDSLRVQAQEAAAAGLLARSGRLKTLLPSVQAALAYGASLHHRDVVATADLIASGHAALRALVSRVDALPGITLPADWNPLDAGHRDYFDAQLTWLRGTAERVAGREGAFAARLREVLALPDARRWRGGREAAALAEAVAALVGVLDLSTSEWSAWLGPAPLVQRWVATRARRDHDLDRSPADAARNWLAFVAAARPFADAGLDGAYRDLLAGMLASDFAVGALQRGIAAAVMQERQVSQGFDEFDPALHDRLIQSFVEGAPRLRSLVATALPTQLLAARSFDPARETGRVGALRRELTRERGGRSVRQLVAEYGDLILKITPCVLVSPGSLARFFPPGAVEFDLVVFDEASQIRVADAVGAMGRARSVVIVGDSKQMPPSTLMEASFADTDESLGDDEEQVSEDLTSILSECVESQIPRRRLTWHYRSQDESLIAFSNAKFYDDTLSSFPSPTRRRDGYGVHFRRIDGHFRRAGDVRPGDGPLGTNTIEARAVVAEIERRFSTAAPDRRPSIGVVTFNAPQRDHIVEMLENSDVPDVGEAVADDGSTGLFVKNLENVQGDERDVILFSTGFSPNAKGVLPLNFGPLNRAGGERRLNVAITRARREVLVFSSFDPQQLRTESTSSKAIPLLRAYLELARDGIASSGDTVATTSSRSDRHRDEVADALRARGWHVRVHVGLSRFAVDLAVADPKRPDQALLAILLDGVAWAGRRTVGDRDGLPVEVLERNMGWPGVARVWLPSWLNDRDAVLDGLDARLQKLSEQSRGPAISYVRPSPAAEPAITLPDTRPAPPALPPLVRVGESLELRRQAITTAPPQVTPSWSDRPRGRIDLVSFQAWEPGQLGSPQDLDAPRLRTRIAAHVFNCLQTESPVTTERLTRAVGRAYGVGRVTQARAREIVSLLPTTARIDADDVVWRTGLDPESWPVVRDSDDPKLRPLDQVPYREIGNAMVHEALAADGAAEDELLRAALAHFGGKRVTENVAARLREALRRASREGRLELRRALWVAAQNS